MAETVARAPTESTIDALCSASLTHIIIHNYILMFMHDYNCVFTRMHVIQESVLLYLKIYRHSFMDIYIYKYIYIYINIYIYTMLLYIIYTIYIYTHSIMDIYIYIYIYIL